MRGAVGPWGAVPLELVRDVRLTRQDIAVYTAMSYRRGNNETMWASMTTIAKDCGIDRKNIHRHVAKLRRCGWIAAIDKKGTGRHYAVLLPFEATTTQTGAVKADAPTDVKYVKADGTYVVKADDSMSSRLTHKENNNTTRKENSLRLVPQTAQSEKEAENDAEIERLRREVYGD